MAVTLNGTTGITSLPGSILLGQPNTSTLKITQLGIGNSLIINDATDLLNTSFTVNLEGNININNRSIQFLEDGTYTVDYRCSVANVLGSGPGWGRLMIKFLERL